MVTELSFRELVEIPRYFENEIILRQFIKFYFDLHEKGIKFLDHSPRNTLVKKVGEEEFAFYLVDLNRMNFHMRMTNLSRLTPKEEMIAVMSDEYAKFYAQPKEIVFEKMWFFTQDFQEKFAKKKRLKKRLKFWKA